MVFLALVHNPRNMLHLMAANLEPHLSQEEEDAKLDAVVVSVLLPSRSAFPGCAKGPRARCSRRCRC
jgi:hypothetical protein